MNTKILFRKVTEQAHVEVSQDKGLIRFRLCGGLNWADTVLFEPKYLKDIIHALEDSSDFAAHQIDFNESEHLTIINRGLDNIEFRLSTAGHSVLAFATPEQVKELADFLRKIQ